MAEFGGSRSSSGEFGSGSSSNPFAVKPAKAGGHASGPHGHGLLRNLLDDAVATAKGIPMGLVQTVEHPIRTVEAVGHSYGAYYGHGFSNFEKQFTAHPLQPLLDALSIPLILAGGAGLAIKGADIAANAGAHGAEAAAALARSSELANAGDFAGAAAAHREFEGLRIAGARAPKLAAAADRFRKGTAATTRYLPLGKDAEGNIIKSPLPSAYSSNLFRRGLTKGTNMITEGVLGSKVPYFSAESKGIRQITQSTSLRAGATASAGYGEVKALGAAAKNKIPSVEAGHGLQKFFVKTGLATALKMPLEDWLKLPKDHPLRMNYKPIAETSGTPDLHMGMPNIKHFVPRYHGTGTPSGAAKRALDLHDYETETTQQFITQLGKTFKYTNHPAAMLRDEADNIHLMRHNAPELMAKEMAGAAELAGKIYRFPLSVWKAMILGQSPRYLVNNVIGNTSMYMAATNPVEFTRGVLHAIKAVHGVRAAARHEAKMGVTMDSIMTKYLPDEFVNREFGYLHHGALSLGTTLQTARSGPASKFARSGLRGAVEKIAYRGPQRASIMGAMTTMPGFRALYREAMKSGKVDSYTAFQNTAHTLLQKPEVRAAIEKRVTDWAGQYYHMTKLEQNITSLVPFYNWTRHALRFGKEQVLSRPVSSAALASLGALGDKQTTQELGHIPDFLKGAIPVGGHAGGVLGFLLGQQINGRKKIVLTGGYNPLGSAADDARAIAALVGGGHAREAIGGQLNPVISGIVAGVTGQKLFSGAKANYSSPLSGALDETFGQLAQTKLLTEVLAQHGIGKATSTKTKKGEPKLYTHDVRQQLSSFLGLNERDYSPKTAAKLYNTEQGIKKGRRHARKFAQKVGTNASRKAVASGSKNTF